MHKKEWATRICLYGSQDSILLAVQDSSQDFIHLRTERGVERERKKRDEKSEGKSCSNSRGKCSLSWMIPFSINKWMYHMFLFVPLISNATAKSSISNIFFIPQNHGCDCNNNPVIEAHTMAEYSIVPSLSYPFYHVQ